MGSFRPDPNILKKHPNAITQQQIDEKGRFIGALLGAAAGEALGAPHAGKKAADAPREITGPGETNDRLLLLMRSLVSRKRFDIEDVAQGLLKWFQGKPKAIGKQTKSALENLRAGEGPLQSGAIAWEDSERKAAGNGTAKVCAPIGLLHVKNLDGLSDDAAAFSKITHYDPRCAGACAGVATAVALLVRGGSDAEEAVSRAATAAGALSDDALAAIERGALHKPSDLHVDGDDAGFVLRTLEIAFAAVASAASFEDGVAAVVSRGGDTESNAAVAGALLGAKFGKSQVPDRWLAKVKAASELQSLADQLYKQL